MRVRVRSGYSFFRVAKYVNRDGSIRKEKITEVVVGPAEITVTAEELQSQEHKVELLDNESTCERSADGDALREEPDPNHSDESMGTSEAALGRNECVRCGREVETASENSRCYCGTKCRVEAQRELLPSDGVSAGPSIIDTLDDEKLFAQAFPDPEGWRSWRAFLRALFALPMSEEEAEVFARHTRREGLPAEAAREAWLVVGRRGGKSRIAALVAVYLACFREYSEVLALGERGTVMVIAADRRQARTVFGYVQGLLDGSPMLSQLVESRTKESINLANRITIEVHTASFRAVRGYTVVAAVLDEIAYWQSDEASANPDSEIVNALRPGMATVPGSLLMAISSPYARRGALWEAHARHFGHEGDSVLVWQADSASMNPTIPTHVIEDAYAQDESAAAAEYGAEFRKDVESFVPHEVVEACTVPDRRELPPIARTSYFAFVDPSGGSSDSMTRAIAHMEGERVVLDLVRERQPPFSPEEVVGEFAATLKAYQCFTVTGDRYAGEWPRERFRVHGVRYEPNAKPKSGLYAELLPLLNGARVELLDQPRLAAQLLALERRTSRGRDDLVNAAAGAIVGAASKAAVPTPRFWRPGARRDVWTRVI